jgi:hypothetical protein
MHNSYVMDNKTIEMDGLLGAHLLSGVETDYIEFKDPESYSDQDKVNVIRFILDGVSYMAVEDPEDGYRSCLGRIFIGVEVKNVFDPIEVLCVKKEEKQHDPCDILQMINPLISKVIVEFGTDYSDDYYPSFVSSFSPRYLTEANYAKSLLENEPEES